MAAATSTAVAAPSASESVPESYGIKVDLVDPTSTNHEEDVIRMLLRVVDPKKRTPQQKENEAIQFDFNILTDNPEEITREMVPYSFQLLR